MSGVGGGLHAGVGDLAAHGDGRRRVDEPVLQVAQQLGRQLVPGARLCAGRAAPRPASDDGGSYSGGGKLIQGTILRKKLRGRSDYCKD